MPLHLDSRGSQYEAYPQICFQEAIQAAIHGNLLSEVISGPVIMEGLEVSTWTMASDAREGHGFI
jgi:hypothetical protein